MQIFSRFLYCFKFLFVDLKWNIFFCLTGDSQGLLGLAQRCEYHEGRQQGLLVCPHHREPVLVQGRGREGQEVHAAAGSAQDPRRRVGHVLAPTRVRSV